MTSLGTSAQRIAWLASINNGKQYLEIGVNQGTTFNSEFLSSFEKKIGVDPKFNFSTDQHKSQANIFVETTSDIFFADKELQQSLSADIIFLDGLHTFEQTFRDFCGSLSIASRTCIWIIDDVKPLSIAQAEPDMVTVNKLKEIIGESHGWWMGDVYKTVVAIHDFFPTFSIAVLPGMTGQAVVWPSPRKDFQPIFNSFKSISNMRYQDFLLLQDTLFAPIDYQLIEQQIKRWIEYIH
jgi:hypothetical protein